jgi:hypothetical protein
MKKIVHKNLQLNLIFLIFEFTLIEHMSVLTGNDVRRLETQHLQFKTCFKLDTDY